jgi:hypothetical protein
MHMFCESHQVDQVPIALAKLLDKSPATTTTTITELSATLDELATAAKELAEREAELERRETELAEGLEAFALARQESAIWSEATAARDSHWRTLIAVQLNQLQPQSPTATVLRHLDSIATAERQMEG